jgi:thiol:disulfide interchange protein
MERLQRVLAIPMAATVAACLWLLWRQSGAAGLAVGLVAVLTLALVLIVAGRRQRRGERAGFAVVLAALTIAGAAALFVPTRPAATTSVPAGTAPWSEAAVQRELAAGRPVFAYFTADWCLSCKVNEAGAIERAEVQAAFRKAGVRTLVGDWTNGDPAITRFIESRGRAGVPLYLWYEPGRGEPEELPQILTPAMLSERANRAR